MSVTALILIPIIRQCRFQPIIFLTDHSTMSVLALNFFTDHLTMSVPALHVLTDHLTMSVLALRQQII